MPAFYTHYRFGCDVLKQLPEDIRSICTAHRGLLTLAYTDRTSTFSIDPFCRTR